MAHAILDGALLGLLFSCCSAGIQAAPAALASAEFKRRPLSVPAEGQAGFRRHEASTVGIPITNRLSASLAAQNQILLNGSGVAAGDYNGDGRCDLYFCTLTEGNRLYRNLGGWRFSDVTESAGVRCEGQFSTGACFGDLDGDGDLDLLVNSLGGGTRFFRNEGAGRYVEQAKAGFQARGGSHSIALADVDGDGDLDVYVTNYRTTTVRDNPIRVRLKQVNGQLVVPPPYEDRFIVHLAGGGRGSLIELGEADVLYLNDGNGKFREAGWSSGFFLDSNRNPVSGPPLDWGLSALFQDLDDDGHPDLYVCNDFSSPDRMWRSDGQGHLMEFSPSSFRHTSWASMSVDAADIDRDGHPDLFVSDMLSAQLERRQTQRGNATPTVQAEDERWDRPQYLRNMLFHNRGQGRFEEIACLAGVEASEWTWGAVFLDVDLDGNEDLLLATGHGFDMQDFDAAERIARLRNQAPQTPAADLMTNYPALRTPNVAFRNRGDLTFEPSGSTWGFDRPGITHGVILADLDNDGDLDVVTSDLNQSPGLYENRTSAPRIAVRLKGGKLNTQAIGAVLQLNAGPAQQRKEMIAGGRYLSGDEALRTFAVDWPGSQPATLLVRWPGGSTCALTNLLPNSLYEITEPPRLSETKLLAPGTPATAHFRPQELQGVSVANQSPLDESTRQPLLPFPLRQLERPSLAIDVDQDGRLDLVLGDRRGGELSVWLNVAEGKFKPLALPTGAADLRGDITSIVGFTNAAKEVHLLAAQSLYAEGDGAGSGMLDLRVQEGRVLLSAWTAAFPMSVGPLALGDVDGDGDLDLFVGGRLVAGRYPEPAPSFWFRNDQGNFVAESFGLDWSKLGLVTAAALNDLTQDGRPDLLVATEWGPLRLFRNTGAGFQEITDPAGLRAMKGLWTCLKVADLDADGIPEVVLGNQGRNHVLNRFGVQPVRLYFGDFNHNGSWATFLAVMPPGKQGYYPLNDLSSLKRQIPSLGQRFTSHREFSDASMEDLFRMAEIPIHFAEANTLEHRVLRWKGNGYEASSLPVASQMAVANALALADFKRDGHLDLVMAQNRAARSVDLGRQDSGTGLILLGDATGRWISRPWANTGIEILGEQNLLTVADWDGDGFPDLLLGETGRPPLLYLNRASPRGERR